ncbi:amino acid adenylation domain-containing protein [Amycolatopsis sp. NPDC049252]|uniref:amino acid adenylation domain-containing protein n=1 Tax=Amycolatopsis sp. NPDC049252 TaxID=3363933 RepID=UPI003722C083
MPQVEAMYSLSPQQRGMFAGALADSSHEGTHIDQFVFTLTGSVDPGRLAAAWRAVVRRHAALRTAFVLADRAEPVQVVLAAADLVVDTLDWRDSTDPGAELDDLLRAERERGFDLTKPPLMRVTLARAAEQRWSLVWTVHHLVTDGWCMPLLVRQVLDAYRADGPAEAAPSYRDYVAWIRAQDPAAAEKFWRVALEGIAEPTPLGPVVEDEEPAARSFAEAERVLPAAGLDALRAVAARQRVTLSSLVEGAWAALLASYSGREDVVFGVTVSGRPPSLPGVEAMIGPFSNIVPLRVPVDPATPVAEWLRGLQQERTGAQPFEYCALGQIHEWSGLPGAQPLFHSALTFENYPVDHAVLAGTELTLDTEDVGFVAARSSFPLVLLVFPGTELSVRAVFDSSRLSTEDVERVLDHLVAVLSAYPEAIERPLAELVARVPAEQAPRLRVAARATGHRGARNDLEAAVAEIFASVLGVERIGIDDSFLDLGGHSLVATQIASRLRERFEIDIPLRTVFDSPTVARLAKVVAKTLHGAGEQDLAITPREAGVPTPASPAQRRLWFLEQLHSGIPFHNMPGGFRLTGRLDRDALERAFTEIVARHEALRTVFATTDGGLVQVVRPEARMALEVEDLAGVSEEDWENVLHRRALELAAPPFDLAGGPLLRAQLVRRTETDHGLLVAVHHIVFDSWSRGIFLRELTALYETFSAGGQPALPPVALQFGDVAAWQDRWQHGPAAEEQIAYWRDRLADVPVLDLFADHVRPALPTFRGGHRRVHVPAELVARLRALGQEENASVFMVLLAAFDLILHRYTRQQDIAVGTPVANRNRYEAEDVLGFLLNSVVLRIALSGEVSFRELVGRVRDAALGAFDHQDIPFERLVEVLQPTRDLAHNPLFQATFAVQQLPAKRQRVGELELTLLEFDSGMTRFDIECNFYESEDGMVGVFTYATDLFAEGTVDALCRQYLKVLEQATEAAGADRPLTELLPLDEDERDAVVDRPNRTAVAMPRDVSLTELFEAQVRRTPDAVALETRAEKLTFAELNARANRLARHLSGLGAGREVPVGLHLPRSADMIVGLLAILKTGGYCLPLDVAYPAQRLSFMLSDIGAKIVVGHGEHLRALEGEEFTPVALDEEADAWAGLAAGNLPAAAGPKSLAIVDYTSGSTGRPKGAGILHENVVRLLHNTRDLSVGPESVTLQLASIAFDVAMFEIWAPLFHGGRLVMWEGGIPTAADLGAAIDGGVTTIVLTATLFNTVVDQDVTQLAGLPQLIVCGERPSVPHIRRALAELPGIRMFNGYGPTECTTFTHYYPIPADLPENRRNIPLGLPIVNTTTYVLDELMNPLPPGMPGEIFVGGEGLARGYLNRPRQTADRFVPNPFGGEPGSRIYRTGDLGRWLPDGNLEFLGRVDSQVKVRGHRVEPGEIEKVLVDHDGVAAAAVVARRGRDGSNQLAAYLVPAPGYRTDVRSGGGERRKADTWRTVYDEIYGGGGAPERFHSAGWNSSYTGRRIPEEQMRAWVADTVARIRSLRPRRILEIGCGTGLLLFELLGDVREYVATDFSRSALDHVRTHLPVGAPVTLAERFADDLSELPDGEFDVVVINSVLQYFPSAAYARRVLDGALKLVAPGGHLFVGDVRHQALQEAFHTSVLLFGADAADEHTDPAEVRAELGRRLVQDDELTLHPAFFADFAGGRAELHLKESGVDTEMNRYRYDVVIPRDEAAEPAAPTVREFGGRAVPLAELTGLLTGGGSRALELRGLRNGRVIAHGEAAAALREPGAVRLLSELKALAGAPDSGIEPQQLRELGKSHGYEVVLSPSLADPHCFDAALRPAGTGTGRLTVPPRLGDAPDPATWASDPMRVEEERELIARVRAWVSERLPDYMKPASTQVLEVLPLTSTGKLDRGALPEAIEARQHTYVAPRQSDEELMAGIWAQVLGVERVGMLDDFFSLGGHSLLATEVVAKAREAFGTEVPLAALFEAPTVAQLCARLRESDAPAAAPIAVLPRTPARAEGSRG